MRPIRLSLILTFAFLGFPTFGDGLSKPMLAQESQCDPHLQQSGNDPYGYRLRGDRCEGVYIKDVAGTTVVASLTEYVEDFNPAASQSLSVEWTAPGNGSVRLRAYSLRHRLYYQMDSERAAGSKSYQWPTNVLAALSLRKSEVGLLAWTSYRVGTGEHPVYLPVRVKQQQAPARSHSYQLVLMPSEELSEVYVSLAPVKKDGSLGVAVITNQALGRGFYPADRGITIPVSQAKLPGIYCLKIGGTFKSGGSSTKEVWFYRD